MKPNGYTVTFPPPQESIPAYRPQGQPSDCCSGDATDATGAACFSSFPRSSTTIDRCLDPIPIMAQNDRARCSSSSACVTNFTCVAYASPDPLLRIGVNADEALRIVLWSGPPLEVWEQGEFFSLTVPYDHSRSTQLRWVSFAPEHSYTRDGYQSRSQVTYRASRSRSHPHKTTNRGAQVLENDNVLPICHESSSTFIPGRRPGLTSHGWPPTKGFRENSRYRSRRQGFQRSGWRWQDEKE